MDMITCLEFSETKMAFGFGSGHFGVLECKKPEQIVGDVCPTFLWTDENTHKWLPYDDKRNLMLYELYKKHKDNQKKDYEPKKSSEINNENMGIFELEEYTINFQTMEQIYKTELPKRSIKIVDNTSNVHEPDISIHTVTCLLHNVV
eukprot:UN05805